MEKNFNLFIRDDLDRIASAEVEQMLTQLPSWRREKALRFKHEQGRKELIGPMKRNLLRTEILDPF